MNRSKRKKSDSSGRKWGDTLLLPGNSGPCRICLKWTSRTCPTCKSVFYCGALHQSTDEGHKKVCVYPLVWQIEVEDSKGTVSSARLVASRDILAGQIIFKEHPAISAPRDYFDVANKFPTCLGCCQRLGFKGKKKTAKLEYSSCGKCGWPLCSKRCERSFQHASYECIYFSERKIAYPTKIDSFRLRYFLYKAVYALRALLFRTRYPESFAELMKLPAMLEPSTVKEAVTHDKLVLKLLNETFQISSLTAGENSITEQDVTTIMNHLSVYGFTTPVLNVNMKKCGTLDAFYWKAAKITRSCLPNVAWTIGPAPDFVLQMTAARNIKANEELTLTYTSRMYREAVHARQEFVFNYYGRSCICPRCQDPSEMGTLFSGVKCDVCQNGYLLSSNPQNLKCFLVCSSEKCSNRVLPKEVYGRVKEIDCQVNVAIESSKATGKVQELQQKVQTLKSEGFLHPNHSVIFKLVWEIVKRQMDQLRSLDWTSLEAFLKNCEYLLLIEEKLCPPLSIGRATLYFFMGRAFFHQYEIFKTASCPERDECERILDKIMDLYDEARQYFVKCGDERETMKAIHMDMKEIVSMINELRKSSSKY